jgi:hypothetical protein
MMRCGLFAVSPKTHVKIAVEGKFGMCSQFKLFTVPDADSTAMWQ